MSVYSFVLKRMMNTPRSYKNLIAPEGIERFNNIQYGEDKKWNLLDLYYPKDRKTPSPVIINVHGGGWVTGDKECAQFYCMDMALRGFAVVNFSYRLAPRHKFPKQLEDTNNAVNWLLDNTEKYQLDKNAVFMIGDSAGAHILGIYVNILTNKNYADNFTFTVPAGFAPNAVCLNCGVYDIEKELANDPRKMTKNLMHDFLGKPLNDKKVKLACVNEFMNENFPPAFVLSAHGDFLLHQVPVMEKKLKELNIPYICKVYGTEENKLVHVFQCNYWTEEAKIANNEQAEFFRTYMEKK